MKLFYCIPKSKLRETKIYGLNPHQSQGLTLTDNVLAAENLVSFSEDSSFIILSVDLNSLDKTKLGPDNFELQDYLDLNPGTYKYWDQASYSFSLEKVGHVLYKDHISGNLLEVEDEINY